MEKNEREDVKNGMLDCIYKLEMSEEISLSRIVNVMRKALNLIDSQEESINRLYMLLDGVCKMVRERHEDDDVCMLCQYDGAYRTESGEWANECPGFDTSECFMMKNNIREIAGRELLGERD